MFKNLEIFNKDEKGVSPVIGVILMVAVTVVLAAVIGTFVLDISNGLDNEAQAGIIMSETNDGIQVQLIDNQNSDKILVNKNGSQVATLNTVGESTTVAVNSGDEITVIGVTEDGKETVLRTYTSNQALGDTTVSGTVSFNPPVEGVTVKALDSSGNVIGQDTTNASGEFSVPKGADSYTVNGYAVNTTVSSGVDIEVDSDSSDVDNNGDTLPAVLMDGSGTSSDPYQIDSASDLQAMERDLVASYKLTENVDASQTKNWNGGSGFDPVGTYSNPFSGTLNGNGYEIQNLTINRPSNDQIGVFGGISGSVDNIGVVNVSISGGTFIGGIAGVNNGGNITNSYVTGDISGSSKSGGLVGQSQSGSSIQNSYSTASVNVGSSIGGGLVGANKGDISNSYATGTVSGGDTIGGLVGDNTGSVSGSYAEGNVDGGLSVGGLIGSDGGSVTKSYATGSVNASNNGGGLIGATGSASSVTKSYATGNVDASSGSGGGIVGDHAGSVSNSYATGSVTGGTVGGIVGVNSGDVTKTYATGSVTGGTVGGIVGENFSNVGSSYWDTSSTGQSSAAGYNGGTIGSGVTGYTTSEMQGSSASTNMSAFDFSTSDGDPAIWTTVSGDYPDLN